MQISNARLILGSGSPRRQALFARFWGHDGFITVVPDFDEEAFIDIWMSNNFQGKTGDLAAALAEGKAKSISKDLEGVFVVVAADTLVVCNGTILGKPDDNISAKKMLKQMSGRQHEVITGLSLAASNGNTSRIWTDYVKTEVKFHELTEPVTEWYISSGEPLDKAGAYGIQGLGSVLVESINGCYYNVMGLPVSRLMTMLQDAAVTSSEFKFISGFLPWS